VHYLKGTGSGVEAKAIASGEADLTMTFAGPLLIRLDAREPLVLLCPNPLGNGRRAQESGVYISVTILWLWLIDSVRPTRWDIIGVAFPCWA
jgi:drug/metabolite transporter superfamily protein YnfA